MKRGSSETHSRERRDKNNRRSHRARTAPLNYIRGEKKKCTRQCPQNGSEEDQLWAAAARFNVKPISLYFLFIGFIKKKKLSFFNRDVGRY